MAFWGTEVKPGKPVTHSSGTAKGRLRISQATLGIGDATKKSLVQCNVGNKSPVLLCALLPNKTESCHMDLEFKEADDVVFSVIGPRSVYLTGYYVNHSRHFNPHSDTESFGVDIENTGTEGSSHCSEDDKYEDSFIDDGELRILSPSPISVSDEIDETRLEHEKPKGNEGSFKRPKKKYRVIESDDDANSHESEDEDSYLLSVFKNRRSAQMTKSEAEERVGQGTVETGDKLEDGGISGSEPKEKADAVRVIDEPKREAKLPHNSLLPSNELDPKKDTEVKDKRNELPKQVETLGDKDNGKDQIQSLALVKSKRKKKERSKEEEKTLEVENGNYNSVLGESREQEAVVKSDEKDPDLQLRNKTYQDPSFHVVVDGDCLVPPAKLSSDNCRKSKKRRKELGLEGTYVDRNGASYDNISNDDEFKQDIANAVGTSKDLQATNGEHQEPTVQKDICVNSHLVPDGSQPEKKYEGKKKNKKNNKIQRDGNSNIVTLELNANKENTFMNCKDQNADAASSQKRTLSSGLIIEEVAKGEPGGKIAAPGKKVTVYYSAMLKESGHIFDSNFGKAPYKFRLGDEDIIDGWNIGINGMRVGDKRRLVIPPSMGYGIQGGENVPPNSWLVYEVELAGVRR
ncbi:peptidyl-prolyl cis-trans isomerase FKBP43-like [Forsythia ovata]|uniref:peptidylprolyl isomerase n=1 Tax=Forsythia ovata TaxID=205694 RepID=A0ABD1VGM8_9LAMI